MARPTAGDPLGQLPSEPGERDYLPEALASMLDQHIDARIAAAWRGRTQNQFEGVPDVHLVAELVARGWAVFKPQVNK